MMVGQANLPLCWRYYRYVCRTLYLHERSGFFLCSNPKFYQVTNSKFWIKASCFVTEHSYRGAQGFFCFVNICRSENIIIEIKPHMLFITSFIYFDLGVSRLKKKKIVEVGTMQNNLASSGIL